MPYYRIERSDLESSEKVLPKRRVFQSMIYGVRQRCPACGAGQLFSRYLKVADRCASCGEAFHHHRADDAPPYFTIFIAGHLIIPLVLAFETALKPPLWVHAVVWLPVSVIVCLALLPRVKGAIVGLQWALYMHGFDPTEGDEEKTLGIKSVG